MAFHVCRALNLTICSLKFGQNHSFCGVQEFPGKSPPLIEIFFRLWKDGNPYAANPYPHLSVGHYSTDLGRLSLILRSETQCHTNPKACPRPIFLEAPADLCMNETGTSTWQFDQGEQKPHKGNRWPYKGNRELVVCPPFALLRVISWPPRKLLVCPPLGGPFSNSKNWFFIRIFVSNFGPD